MFPPSPALSLCDSLDGIDDLDAFLCSQGRLSRWPTPPHKPNSTMQWSIVNPDAVVDQDQPDCKIFSISGKKSRLKLSLDAHLATTITHAASIAFEPTPLAIDTVRDLLRRADLPLEFLALALSILSQLQQNGSHDDVDFNDTPPDLLVVSTLSIALSYTSDKPPKASWWSRYVCDCCWTAARIDHTVWKVLDALDFRVHSCTNDEDLKAAMAKLQRQPTKSPQPLKVSIDSTTSWEHGQFTPETTPPPTASAELTMPLMRFLPVL